MPWFKVDDTLAFHAKTLAAGNAAMGLWVRAGSWSMQTLSDGFVPTHVARQLGTRAEAKRLVDARLWVEKDDGYQMVERRLWRIVIGKYRRKISRAVRRLVMARDGYRCRQCGATDRLTLDHVFPYSLGGGDSPENLQVLCMPCNRQKGAQV